MDPANRSSDVEAVSEVTYEEILIAAVSTINDGNGADIVGIYEFIEDRYNVPPDYKMLLEEELETLVSHNKLEVETRYKIVPGAVTQTSNAEDSTKSQEIGDDASISSERALEIREAAAKAIAEADQKEFEAKEACEALEKVKELAERSDMILELAQETYERCAKGETVLLNVPSSSGDSGSM